MKKEIVSLKIIWVLILLAVSPVFAEIMDHEKDFGGLERLFVEVKAGTFQMGSPLHEVGRDLDEIPHLVTLTRDFEIQITEVTQFQYFSVTGSNPSHFSKRKYCRKDYLVIKGQPLCPYHPVERVSWNEVQSFVSQLNEKDDQYTYRLPTEAEWEYAARGCQGSGQPTDQALCATTTFNLGDHISTSDVNYNGSYSYHGGVQGVYRGQTVRVESLSNVNELSLYDTHGNVGEWVEDKYGIYPSSPVVDPQGHSWDFFRVVRGGSWTGFQWNVRLANRSSWRSDQRTQSVGFRLVRTAR